MCTRIRPSTKRSLNRLENRVEIKSRNMLLRESIPKVVPIIHEKRHCIITEKGLIWINL